MLNDGFLLSFFQMLKRQAPDIFTKDVLHFNHSAVNQMLKSAFAYHGYTVQKFPEVMIFF